MCLCHGIWNFNSCLFSFISFYQQFDLALNVVKVETTGLIKVLGVTPDKMFSFKENISEQLKRTLSQLLDAAGVLYQLM